MIALTLFTLLDDQEDDSLASGGKVECLHIVIQLCFWKVSLHYYIRCTGFC